MNEAEFKRLPVDEKIKIVNKRCDELGGKHKDDVAKAIVQAILDYNKAH